MPVCNKACHNHALMSLNKIRRDGDRKQKVDSDFQKPSAVKILLSITDCLDF